MMIEEYLSERPNLNQVFMLIDFRHKPTEDDLLMYNFLKFHGVKVTLIATKVDKIGSTQREKYKKQIIFNAQIKISLETSSIKPIFSVYATLTFATTVYFSTI